MKKYYGGMLGSLQNFQKLKEDLCILISGKKLRCL